mmetsp:Transcript_10306/g.27350  ORF Transcript_10306/g.27350 Transcript_10306/m.27350 type:complete len:146 (+) Transcript_10306:100-537(+)
MKRFTALAAAFTFATMGEAASLRQASRQPIFEGKVDSDDTFAKSVDDTKPARIPGYRNAWDDCGGIGASATERMRSIAARIKGWAKPLPFARHAAQDCGSANSTGTVPGPGENVVYPGPETLEAARAGLEKADSTLKKYPTAAGA